MQELSSLPRRSRPPPVAAGRQHAGRQAGKAGRPRQALRGALGPPLSPAGSRRFAEISMKRHGVHGVLYVGAPPALPALPALHNVAALWRRWGLASPRSAHRCTLEREMAAL